MPSRLKRYQNEGNHHFLTFSCYRRLPFLDNDHARKVFLDILEVVRRRHQFFSSVTSSCPNMYTFC